MSANRPLVRVDAARRHLSRTEPLEPAPFTVGSDRIRFTAEDGWNHGIKIKDGDEPVPVIAMVGDHMWQLSKETVQEIGLAVGLPRAYVNELPGHLLAPQLNYWFSKGLLSQPRKKKDYQFLIRDDTAVAFGKQGIRPFSNLALLDEAVAQITEQFGEQEVLADYKLAHSLRRTHVRLIVPACKFQPTGDRDDEWSIGIAIKNSLLGTSQTTIEGYLFRWICTNGQIDSRAHSGVFTRRKDATDAEVSAWARQSVSEVLTAVSTHGIEQLSALTKIAVNGDLIAVLRDIFEHYRIPVTIRPRIISILEDYDGDITMYVVMNAVTQAANAEGLDPATVDALMRVGGDLPYTAAERCAADNPCGRLLHSH